MDCSVTGCLRPDFAKGFCHSHYDEQRRPDMPECSIVGCEKKQHAKGRCGKHYRAQLREVSVRCGYDGCDGAQVANGLCNTHYKRVYRHGDVDGAGRKPTLPNHPLYQTWKGMNRSANKKPPKWSDFKAFIKDVGEKPAPTSWLRPINKKKPIGPGNFYWYDPKKHESREASRERDKARSRDRTLRTRFGITLDDYNRMLEEQGGGCAICGGQDPVKNRMLAVDHDHATGKVRALLCTACNIGLGNFDDSIERLEAAIEYLKCHK